MSWKSFRALLVANSLIVPCAQFASAQIFIQRRLPISAEPHAVDALVNLKADGNQKTVLTDALMDVCAFRTTSDGSQILCLRRTPDGSKTQIQFLTPDGQVKKTIDVSSLHVFGAPVLLPDKMHIGLTICDQPGVANHPDKADKSLKPRQKKRLERERAQGKATFADLSLPSAFPPDPSIAVIDLDGKNLNVIAPGMLPDWSPDGRKILYTMVDSKNGLYILHVMSSTGRGDVPLGVSSSTCAGVYSPDGRRIAYIGVSQGSAAVYVTEHGGVFPNPVTGTTTGDLSQFSSVRWLHDGKTLQLDQLLNSTGKTSHPVGTPDDSPSVWTIQSDGSAFRQASPKSMSAITDLDVDRMVFSVMHQQAPSFRKPAEPELTQWDPNKPIEFAGSRVYTRDDQGHRIPAPDGRYRLPNGSTVVVNGGKKTIISN